MARDPDRTRRSILEAALVEFSLRGLAGARVDRIAESAAVNKRMIYHHFGNKAGLYRALMEQRLGAVTAAAARRGVALGDVLADRLAAETHDSHFVRLLMWEALAEIPARDPDDAARTTAWQGLVAELRERQAAGLLRNDVDAAELELSLVALVLFPIAFPQLTRMITGRSPGDAPFLAVRGAFLRTLAQLLEGHKPRYRLAPRVTSPVTGGG